eukprot:2200961-Prymnesium_polylepis.1
MSAPPRAPAQVPHRCHTRAAHAACVGERAGACVQDGCRADAALTATLTLQHCSRTKKEKGWPAPVRSLSFALPSAGSTTAHPTTQALCIHTSPRAPPPWP